MRGPFLGSLGSSDTVSCPEASYVDDLALFKSHDSPGKLCDRVVDITNRLTEIMASFGLELNMKAGKTECMLSLRGRGTAEAQRQLARDGKQIILPTKYAKLRVVQSYCHLGIILTNTGCITPEIAKRCKAMLGAYLPIAHRFFASREICRSTKLQLAHALLDGILSRNAPDSLRVLSCGKLVEEAGTPRAEYQCPECAKVFLSSRARATHESRVHGKQRPALAYARDGKCPCCSCDFHSRVRLVHLLSYSSVKCLHFCVENSVPVSQEEQRPLDAADAAFRRQCKFEGRSFLAAQVPVDVGQIKADLGDPGSWEKTAVESVRSVDGGARGV